MGTITVSAYYLTFHSRETEKISKTDSMFQPELIQNANVLKKQRRLLC